MKKFVKEKKKLIYSTVATLSAFLPVTAYADISSSDVNTTFHDVCSKIAIGIILFGGIFVVWGLVQVGQGINGDGGGQELKSGFKHLAGGLVVAAAGGIFLAFTQMVNI